MTRRRLILLAVAAAVIGGLGFWAYDRYLGGELSQGEELREALADELASAGFAYTSLEYDWRKRRVVAEGLAATELPEGITGFSIGKAVYRGAGPATIRAVFEQADGAAADGKAKPVELIADLELSDVYIGFENGVEFKQASLTLKHVSLGKPVRRDAAGQGEGNPVLKAADMARRVHVRLLEAGNIHVFHPDSQSSLNQKYLRLEDYRGGDFSEFRLEGLNLSAALVFRAKLDEFFLQSVKARKFLANFHRMPLFGMTAELTGGNRPDGYASAAESAIVAGDWALIGFEALIPAAGRIAFEEIAASDRQFVNGLELGGKSKVVALELQFNMLTQVLTAGLEALGEDVTAAAAEAGSEAEAWMAARAANIAPEGEAVAASLQAEEGDDGTGSQEPAADSPQAPRVKPQKRAGRAGSPDDQIPMGPRDGEVTEGPAAPVPEVWGNEIEPPGARPEIDKKRLAEIIRKLGFDNMRINGEFAAGFDRRGRVWELSEFVFDMDGFWKLSLDLRLGGVGALEDLGHVPLGPEGWWQGPKADAVGERLLEEGRFESFSLTYREQGFLSRLMSLIAERQGTNVEALAGSFANALFAGGNGAPLGAEGLAEAVEAFLVSPERFALHLQPEEPVPFRAFPALNEADAPLPEAASRLGLELTFNDRSFADFKNSAPIASDIQAEPD